MCWVSLCSTQTTKYYIMGMLVKAKEKKSPMTINTPKKKVASKDQKTAFKNTPGLYFSHAYTILNINPSKKQIKLFNPWGKDHPNGSGWMDIEQVRKFFIEVNING
ncbi:MAG TPA: C2 family cysteine protease [Nostocaceae cyanobacterium]|nr:C2 family cysteine protease [Nostocaceae cyanobacterium]